MLEPLEDRVIIKIIENEDKTKGKIILTGTLQDEIQYAKVIQVGTGTDKVNIKVKKGQKIVINSNIGTKIKYEGEDLIIINYNDILAVIK